MTRDELIKEGYRHKGLAFGFIPVYVHLDGEVCITRKWVPDILMGVSAWIYAFITDIVDPYGLTYGGSYPIKITGEI